MSGGMNQIPSFPWFFESRPKYNDKLRRNTKKKYLPKIDPADDQNAEKHRSKHGPDKDGDDRKIETGISPDRVEYKKNNGARRQSVNKEEPGIKRQCHLWQSVKDKE